MRYQGGKHVLAKRIAGYLGSIRKIGQPYWEPFVGGGSVLANMVVNDAPMYASDIDGQLIALWKAIFDGWLPPKIVTESDFQKAKSGLIECEALAAFVLIGCSWGGIKGLSYARQGSDGRIRNHPATESRNGILRKARTMEQGVNFFCRDFFVSFPPEDNCLIYCDIPYKDTIQYNGMDFDHDWFYYLVRQLERDGNTVIVSEKQAPDDFSKVCILKKPKSGCMERKTQEKYEYLFRLGNHDLARVTV